MKGRTAAQQFALSRCPDTAPATNTGPSAANVAPEMSPNVLYQRICASERFVSKCCDIDKLSPIVPVIVVPSTKVNKGAGASGSHKEEDKKCRPPISGKQLGFLQVSLRNPRGPGMFFPLFPDDKTQRDKGVSCNNLDAFNNSSHWANNGCVRLLTDDAEATIMSECKFAAMWELNGERDWHIPYGAVVALQEAFGGLCSILLMLNSDVSGCHYMLKGWDTASGRPTMKSRGNGGYKFNMSPKDVEQRPLRAMANEDIWKDSQNVSLLRILETEGHAAMSCDKLDYWISRLGASFQQKMKENGILGRSPTVHHIIAQGNRGIVSWCLRYATVVTSLGLLCCCARFLQDHPLNYFIIEVGQNSAMGKKIELIKDTSGKEHHMRDIVGERWYEVAVAACNLYHGILYAGKEANEETCKTMRRLRQAAFDTAAHVIEERQQKRERSEDRKKQAEVAQC